MTWLTVKEAASICSSTESAIQKAVKQNRYDHCYVDGVGRGGRQLRVALESLSDTAQAGIMGKQNPLLTFCSLQASSGREPISAHS